MKLLIFYQLLCQHFWKYTDNSIENIHSDVGVQKVKSQVFRPSPFGHFSVRFPRYNRRYCGGNKWQCVDFKKRNWNVKFINFLSTSYSFERLRNITSYLDNLLIKTTF